MPNIRTRRVGKKVKIGFVRQKVETTESGSKVKMGHPRPKIET